MPSVREVKRCRTYVVVERDGDGRPVRWERCLAPAARDEWPDCQHGAEARAWVAKFAPEPSGR